MRAKLLGKLVQVRRGDLLKARFVDIGHDLHADRLQLVGRLMLQLERLGGLGPTHLIGRRRHPLLLLIGQALPQLVADPDEIVIGFVLGHRKHWRHLVMLVDQIDIDPVFGHIDHARLQRRINAAERHMHGLRSIGRKHRVLGCRCLNTNFEALHVFELMNLFFAIHVAKAKRDERDDVPTLHRILDHVLNRLNDLWVRQRLLQMIFRPEQKMQRHHAGLRRERSGVRRRTDAELDVARLQELQNLRLLPKLRSGILIDEHGALAQLLELFGKDVAGNAVTGVSRLVVGKAEVASFLGLSRRRPTGARQAERDQANDSRRSEHFLSSWLSLPGSYVRGGAHPALQDNGPSRKTQWPLFA